MNKNNNKLEKGEAEQLVKQVREHLRSAQTHSQQGDTKAEAKEIAASHSVFSELANGVSYILNAKATRVFKRRSHMNFDCLVQEMTIGLWKELQKINETRHSLFFEQNFKVALDGCVANVIEAFFSDKALYNDSITRAGLKKIRKEQEVADGKREKLNEDREDTAATPLSLNFTTDDGKCVGELVDNVVDKQSLHAMQNVFTLDILQRYYAEILPEDAVFVEAVFRGDSIEEAASKAGIPPRTAFERRKKMYKRLCELFGIAQTPGGVIDEMASEFVKPNTKPKARAKVKKPRAH